MGADRSWDCTGPAATSRIARGYRLTGKLSPREMAERRWAALRIGIEAVEDLERRINGGRLVAESSADQGVK
jgi:hypothetical protein